MNRSKPGSSLSYLFLVVVFAVPESLARDKPVQVNAGSQAQVTSLRALGPAKNLNDLISRLRASGQRVVRGGKVSQPFLSVRGRTISVDGEQVQVFQYGNAQAAERDAKTINPQGSSVSTSMPMWIASPHFYKSGRIIVLYVGESPTVIKSLERAVGPQFAGK